MILTINKNYYCRLFDLAVETRKRMQMVLNWSEMEDSFAEDRTFSRLVFRSIMCVEHSAERWTKIRERITRMESLSPTNVRKLFPRKSIWNRVLHIRPRLFRYSSYFRGLIRGIYEFHSRRLFPLLNVTCTRRLGVYNSLRRSIAASSSRSVRQKISRACISKTTKFKSGFFGESSGKHFRNV